MNIHFTKLKIMSKVVIIMGSKADLEWAKQISNVLTGFEIETITRIASAH